MVDLNEAIQHAKQVACSNSDCANEHQQLVQWLTELQQYRNNPLANMKPCWKYVRQNNMDQQLAHISSEISEVRDSIGLHDFALEVWDIFQGAYTGMIILQAKYGVDITELTQEGIDKNTNRPGGSYYE